MLAAAVLDRSHALLYGGIWTPTSNTPEKVFFLLRAVDQ